MFLGRMLKELGVWGVFPVLPGTSAWDPGRRRRTDQLNDWCVGGVTLKVLGSVIDDVLFERPGTLTLDGMQLTSGAKTSWAEDSVREGDVLLSDREEPGNTVTLESRRGKPQIFPRGIWEGSSENITWLIARLKCHYFNAS